MRHFFTRGSLTAFARASEWGVVALVALVAAPGPVFACAVCGGGNPANRFAFFASTIVLSLLPLGLFVAAFLWLRARLRARGGSEFVEREPLETPPLPALLETTSRDPGEPHHLPVR
jgi:hypothetical protein